VSNIYGAYFTPHTHNWNMFDIDKEFDNISTSGPLQTHQSMAYLAFRNSISDSIIYTKGGPHHCYCPYEHRTISTYHYNYNDSPYVMLEPALATTINTEGNVYHVPPSGDPTCG